MIPDFVFTALSGIVWVGSMLFIVTFWAEPWWRRNPFGRSLMAMAIAVWLFSTMAFMRLFFGRGYPLEELLRLTVYLLAVYAVWSRYFVLRAERRKDATTDA